MNVIMIRLIIKDFESGLKKKFEKKIIETLRPLDDLIKTQWHLIEDYQADNEKDCVLGLRFKKSINIQDLLVLFDCCQWQYAISEVINKQDEVCEYERAIWSKLCNPNEIFIDPKVQWVHIYNWD